MTSQNILFRFVVLTLLVAFFFGSYFLENIGVQYVSEGGNPVFKLHLYSYLTVIMFATSFLNRQIRLSFSGLGGLESYWLVSVACISFVVIYGLFRQGMSGMAYLVDTVLTPLLMVPLLLLLEDKQKDTIIKILAWLVLINSFIAIVEFSLSRSFIFVEFLSFSHFRSPALLGHPLNNALITATLAPLLMAKTRLPAPFYFFTVLLSLFAFGGRGAMGIFILGSIVISLPVIKRFMTHGVTMTMRKFSLYQIVFFLVLIAGGAVLVLTSIGDRILSKLYIDNSAQARFDVFAILAQMDTREWLLGASNTLKSNLAFFIGQKTIENYLVGWLFSFGLLGAVPLLISVFNMPIRMVANMPLNAKVSLMSLFLVSITNNALSVKTTVLLFVFTALTCLIKRKK